MSALSQPEDRILPVDPGPEPVEVWGPQQGTHLERALVELEREQPMEVER